MKKSLFSSEFNYIRDKTGQMASEYCQSQQGVHNCPSAYECSCVITLICWPCRRVVWVPDSDSGDVRGFSLFYPAIVMHAVSRDTSDFHSACIYMQLDSTHSFGDFGKAESRDVDSGEARNCPASLSPL